MPNQVFIAENGHQSGPFSEEEIRTFAQQGRVTQAAYCWFEGMAAWQPIEQIFPGIFQPAAPAAPVPAPVPAPARPVAVQPVAAPAPAGFTEFEIVKADYYQMPKITMSNSDVVLESGALHYMIGSLAIDAQMPSVGGFLKSALTKEKAVRPHYRGTGVVYLEPTFAQCNIMELRGEEWILDKGAFLACDCTVQVGMYTNKSLTGLFGGEGFFQTSVSGVGKVIYLSQGPLEVIQLVQDTLVVDGSFAVARTGSLEFKVEKATKGLFSSLASGEGMVNTFSGTGTVMIAPVPNRFLTMSREFGGLFAAIRAIKS